MMQINRWKRWAVGGAAALAVMASASAWMVDSAYAAGAQPGVTFDSAHAQTLQTVGYGRGHMDSRFGRFGGNSDAMQEQLAGALGISVEELEAAQDAAHDKARDAALAEAVASGDLTQAQADAILELEGLWGNRSFDGGRFGAHGGVRVGPDEYEAFLAEALEISVEELRVAREAAMQTGIAQAVADGTITQEQADRLLAGLALKDYVAGELDSAIASAIEKAVADGAITQEQADQIQEEWNGFGGPGMHGGFPGSFPGGLRGDFDGGMRGGFPGMRGGFHGNMRGGFGVPDTQSYEGMNVAAGSTL